MGPLASGGLQMGQGLTLYLKARNNTLAGQQDQKPIDGGGDVIS